MLWNGVEDTRSLQLCRTLGTPEGQPGGGSGQRRAWLMERV